MYHKRHEVGPVCLLCQYAISITTLFAHIVILCAARCFSLLVFVCPESMVASVHGVQIVAAKIRAAGRTSSPAARQLLGMPSMAPTMLQNVWVKDSLGYITFIIDYRSITNIEDLQYLLFKYLPMFVFLCPHLTSLTFITYSQW